MDKFLFLSALTFLGAFSTITANPINLHADDKQTGPYKVYRIYPNSTDDLDYVVELWKSASKHKINFWKEPSLVGSPIDIMVPPNTQRKFENQLFEHGLDYLITIQDVQSLIEERERKPSETDNTDFENKKQRDDTDGNDRVPFFDFRRYHSYEEMRVYMRALERRYPTLAKVYSLGFSHEGRPIEMIKIGFPLSARGKKSIWIDGGIHAREWASTTTAIYFMHQLATKYEKDEQITQYVKELNWYITPLLNPDGYEYTRSSTHPEIRMWRKNRSPNTGTCSTATQNGVCCMGVDLNRNFDFHWGESGASSNPCEEIYQGTVAFSEPEARAVRDFVMAHRNDIQAVITMHTYSQIWVHPFGDQRYHYPDDVDELKQTGNKAAAALETLYGTKYKVGSGADTLYPAAGGSDDWSKAKAGIKYVYLLELRPEETVWDGFILDANQILPTGRETWEGVKVVVNSVLKRIGITPVSEGQTNKPSAPFSSRRLASSRTTSDRSSSASSELDNVRVSAIDPSGVLSHKKFDAIPTDIHRQENSAEIEDITNTSDVLNFDILQQNNVYSSTAFSTTSISTSILSTIANPSLYTVTFPSSYGSTVFPSTTDNGSSLPLVSTNFSSSSLYTATATFSTALPDIASPSTSTQTTTTTTISTSSQISTVADIDASNAVAPGGISSLLHNSCFDALGENRCARWVNLRDGICQRIERYMRENCAKTCSFCFTKSL